MLEADGEHGVEAELQECNKIIHYTIWKRAKKFAASYTPWIQNKGNKQTCEFKHARLSFPESKWNGHGGSEENKQRHD